MAWLAGLCALLALGAGIAAALGWRHASRLRGELAAAEARAANLRASTREHSAELEVLRRELELCRDPSKVAEGVRRLRERMARDLGTGSGGTVR